MICTFQKSTTANLPNATLHGISGFYGREIRSADGGTSAGALPTKRKGNIFVTKNLPQIAYFYHLFFETTNIFVFLHLKNECATRKKTNVLHANGPERPKLKKGHEDKNTQRWCLRNSDQSPKGRSRHDVLPLRGRHGVCMQFCKRRGKRAAGAR